MKTVKIGMRFGHLVVEAEAGRKDRSRLWRCVCDCGGATVKRTGHLNAGRNISCGCAIKKNNLRHGRSRTPEYKAWDNARSRCRNPNNSKYPLYGGRGIKMCDEWAVSFEAFFEYIGPRPSPLHSLDRLDSNGDYAPGNVRWATAKEQNNNRSFNRRLFVNGVSMTVSEASRAFGIPHGTILSRLNAGATYDEAIAND